MNDHGLVDRWACTFTASSNCTHNTLFKDEYQRTNRVNRTKIVRCFPHCCPRHKPRSYCGSRLLVTVTAPASSHSISLDDHELQVFARFRTEHSDAVQRYPVLPNEFIYGSLQSAENPTAAWVTSRVISRSHLSWVFEINPAARWLYAWDSGATKAQRLMRHLLEVFVVTPRRGLPDSLYVLATTRSPTFTFVSFRRAADSSAAPVNPSLLYRAPEEELQQRSPEKKATRHAIAILPRKRLPPEPPMESLVPVQPVKQALIKKRRLVELPYQSFPDALARVLTWTGRLLASRLAPLLPTLETDLVGRHRVGGAAPRHDAASVGAQLLWWLHTNVGIDEERRSHARRAWRWLGHPLALHQVYDQWLVRVQRHCDAFLATHGWTWSRLFIEIPITDAKPFSHAFDFHSFVAIVRQHVITSSSRQESFWRHSSRVRVWTSGIDDIIVRPTDTITRPVDLFTVDSLFAFWIHLSVIRIEVTIDERSGVTCLYVQSALSRAERPGMRLILDGRGRCFNTLPHGESSLGGAAASRFSIGEYVGSITRSAGGLLVMDVTFYAWPQDEYDRSAVRWQCVITFPLDDSGIHVLVRVERGPIAQSSKPPETMVLCDKLALVDEWVSTADVSVSYRPLSSRPLGSN